MYGAVPRGSAVRACASGAEGRSAIDVSCGVRRTSLRIYWNLFLAGRRIIRSAFAYHQCVCLDPSAYIDFGASHWADRQHGRSFGSARCPHGISRRDGRRAEYAFESGNFRDPRDRALRLSIQETNLCDRENFSSGCQVSIEIL